jgi:hypothetical protein
LRGRQLAAGWLAINIVTTIGLTPEGELMIGLCKFPLISVAQFHQSGHGTLAFCFYAQTVPDDAFKSNLALFYFIAM